MERWIDHVALLVPDLEAAERLVRPLDLVAGEIEEFPSEGTRELYLGPPGAPGRLLLMQALGRSGPYARALAKRGPGLHHLGLATPDPAALIEELPGWLLHPHSLQSLPEVVWLARPGVGCLIEVSQADGPPPKVEPTVRGLGIRVTPGLEPLVQVLLGPGPESPSQTGLVASDAEPWLELSAGRLDARTLAPRPD